jgi:hypothetical protein
VIRAFLSIWLVWIVSMGCAGGQELEPRAYSPAPVGVNFVVVGVGRAAGGVLLDPSIRIDELHATSEAVTIGYGRTFAVAGRQALFLAAIPIGTLEASGRIGDHRETVSRTGLADPRLKLSIGLAGAPALTPAEFARRQPRTAVGASVSIVSPSGQYDARRLINLGANRWSLKPEIGVSHPMRRWTVEAYTGVWLYTTNDSFYPGSSSRTQDPTVAVQAHTSYEIGRHAWAALDATWFGGGRSAVDGLPRNDRQSNTRVGATVSIPLWAKQSLKGTYSTGASTRAGTDFNAFAVSWQLTVF